jgi:cytoskeletal protein CcmA (bactofilin family)
MRYIEWQTANRLAEVLVSKDQSPLPVSGSGPTTGVTIIGQTMRIQGTMTSGEDVHLNGHMEGQMELDGRLNIGTGGKADANIKADEVIVAGSAKGNVETSGRLVLRAGASLEGDVKATGVVIEDGAYFKGGVDIVRPPSS